VSQQDGSKAAGVLHDQRQHVREMLSGKPSALTRPAREPELQMAGGSSDSAPLSGDISGSGPWFWAGSGTLAFLRGGLLITPWGEGSWGVSRKDGEVAPTNAVFADFANSQHTVRMHNPSCMRMQSKRKADGDVVGVDFVGTAGSQKCRVRP
jgi:hypothetical protein